MDTEKNKPEIVQGQICEVVTDNFICGKDKNWFNR